MARFALRLVLALTAFAVVGGLPVSLASAGSHAIGGITARAQPPAGSARAHGPSRLHGPAQPSPDHPDGSFPFIWTG